MAGGRRREPPGWTVGGVTGGPAEGDGGGRVVVAVRVGAAQVDLVADELFVLGASAVGEHPADDGTVELVADLPADRVSELHRPHRRVVPVAAPSAPPHPPVRVAGFVLAPVDPAGGVADGSLVVDDPECGRTVWLHPEVAFGSGTHPTTRLCVAAVVDLVVPGSRVVDVGSGNGVLSVVAARCGATEVVALDVDPAARAETARAARRNGVADRVVVVDAAVDELADGSGDPSTVAAEVVLANLLVGTIEDHATALVGLVAPGGVLVVSGLLAPQVHRAVAALRTAARRADRAAWVCSASAEGDWRAVVFRLGLRRVKAV